MFKLQEQKYIFREIEVFFNTKSDDNLDYQN